MRTRIPLGGRSRDLRSRRSREDIINGYIETDNEGEFKRLSRAPGLQTLSTVGDGPIRGMYAGSNAMYVVSGNEFYRVVVSPFGAISATLKGTVSGFTGPVSIDAIGTDLPQVMALTSGTGYIYNESTDAFTEITDVSFTPDYGVTSFNQRFWLNKPNSNEFFGSDILDGLNYDPLFFASADNNPDILRIPKAVNTELYLMGSSSIERWQDIGTSTGFPLRRVQGGTINRGVAATRSVARWENTLFFLADDYTVRSITGGQMNKVSDLAFEEAVPHYSALSSAFGFFVDYPHYKCYCITFPGNNVTWCYDVLRNWWHKRDSFGVDGWRVGCSVNFAGLVLLGDRFNGNIYSMSNEVYTEGGIEMPMTWITPSVNENEVTMTYSLVELVVEVGVGDISNVQANGMILNGPVPPTIGYARSINGGFSYKNLADRSLGTAGSRMKKVIWRDPVRVPRTNDLVHKFVASGDFQMSVYSAWVDGDPGLV